MRTSVGEAQICSIFLLVRKYLAVGTKISNLSTKISNFAGAAELSAGHILDEYPAKFRDVAHHERPHADSESVSRAIWLPGARAAPQQVYASSSIH